jgi:GntR family transcriptional regulator
MSSAPQQEVTQKRSNRSSSPEHGHNEQILSKLSKGLDRELPVPLGVQLRGLIQYGIALGDLPAGMRLPSVRELADQAGVAPMTVVGVYNELKQQKLIESRGSAGTFVMQTERLPATLQIEKLNPAIDALLQMGKSLGVDAAGIATLINARANHLRFQVSNGLQLVLIGIFPQATTAYADNIRPHLPETDTLSWITLDALRSGAAMPKADIVLTPANRRAEVEAVVGPDIPVVGLSFIPSELTRTRLAGLDPSTRVGIVSIFPEFMALMKPGVMRFSPHVASTAVTMVDAPNLDEFIAGVDVVVYATGLDWLADRVGPHQQAFEYRHMPDINFVHHHVLPLLDTLRQNGTAKDSP